MRSEIVQMTHKGKLHLLKLALDTVVPNIEFNCTIQLFHPSSISTLLHGSTLDIQVLLSHSLSTLNPWTTTKPNGRLRKCPFVERVVDIVI